jgi:drug/metabolite transporter (DMT)-like permease
VSARALALPRQIPLALGRADAMALLAVVLWGLNFPVLKQMMVSVPPLPSTFLRASASAVIFAALLARSDQWRLPRRRDVPRLLGVGLLGMTLNSVLYAEGLHRTSASHAGLLYTLTPLLVFGLSHLLGYLRLVRRDLLGLGLGLFGAALIVGVPLLLGGDSGAASLPGDLLFGAAALVWGVWTLAAMPLLRRYGTLWATAWLTGLNAAGLLPLALPGLMVEDWTGLPLSALAAFAYSATLAGAAGGLLWYAAVRRLGAARTMIYSNLQSFFAVLFAALLLGERVEPTALAGGLAVIGGVLLTRRRKEG